MTDRDPKNIEGQVVPATPEVQPTTSLESSDDSVGSILASLGERIANLEAELARSRATEAANARATQIREDLAQNAAVAPVVNQVGSSAGTGEVANQTIRKNPLTSGRGPVARVENPMPVPPPPAPSAARPEQGRVASPAEAVVRNPLIPPTNVGGITRLEVPQPPVLTPPGFELQERTNWWQRVKNRFGKSNSGPTNNNPQSETNLSSGGEMQRPPVMRPLPRKDGDLGAQRQVETKKGGAFRVEVPSDPNIILALVHKQVLELMQDSDPSNGSWVDKIIIEGDNSLARDRLFRLLRVQRPEIAGLDASFYFGDGQKQEIKDLTFADRLERYVQAMQVLHNRFVIDRQTGVSLDGYEKAVAFPSLTATDTSSLETIMKYVVAPVSLKEMEWNGSERDPNLGARLVTKAFNMYRQMGNGQWYEDTVSGEIRVITREADIPSSPQFKKISLFTGISPAERIGKVKKYVRSSLGGNDVEAEIYETIAWRLMTSWHVRDKYDTQLSRLGAVDGSTASILVSPQRWRRKLTTGDFDKSHTIVGTAEKNGGPNATIDDGVYPNSLLVDFLDNTLVEANGIGKLTVTELLDKGWLLTDIPWDKLGDVDTAFRLKLGACAKLYRFIIQTDATQFRGQNSFKDLNEVVANAVDEKTAMLHELGEVRYESLSGDQIAKWQEKARILAKQIGFNLCAGLVTEMAGGQAEIITTVLTEQRALSQNAALAGTVNYSGDERISNRKQRKWFGNNNLTRLRLPPIRKWNDTKKAFRL